LKVGEKKHHPGKCHLADPKGLRYAFGFMVFPRARFSIGQIIEKTFRVLKVEEKKHHPDKCHLADPKGLRNAFGFMVLSRARCSIGLIIEKTLRVLKVGEKKTSPLKMSSGRPQGFTKCIRLYGFVKSKVLNRLDYRENP
jgi:hypothetical protein